MGLTRVGPRFQVTIPKAAREAVGLKVGDLMEALREAEADIKAGRVHGPFSSASSAIRFLHKESAKHRKAKKRK